MAQLFGQTLCAPQPERDFFFSLQQTSALWFCCTVDHSSCVELLLSSLLICRTSCSCTQGLENLTSCSTVWKATQCKLFVGDNFRTTEVGMSGWLMQIHVWSQKQFITHYLTLRQLYLSLENSSDWVRMLSNNWVVLELDDGSVGSSYIWP